MMMVAEMLNVWPPRRPSWTARDWAASLASSSPWRASDRPFGAIQREAEIIGELSDPGDLERFENDSAIGALLVVLGGYQVVDLLLAGDVLLLRHQ